MPASIAGIAANTAAPSAGFGSGNDSLGFRASQASLDENIGTGNTGVAAAVVDATHNRVFLGTLTIEPGVGG